MFEMSKKEFMYRCTMQAMQGSFANASSPQTPARMVREAEKLWQELQEWEQMQNAESQASH